MPDRDTLWLTTIRAGRPEPAVSSGVTTFDVLHGAGLRSRLALMVQGRTEPRAQVAVTDGEELLGLVPLDVSGAESAFTDLRDVAVAFAWEEDQLMAQVVDPFGLSVEGERAPIATRDESIPGALAPVAAVGSNKLGLAGACYGLPSGSRGGSGIGFALVGPDGAPHGRPVAVVESMFRGDSVSCAVGSDERGFLVAWWNGSSCGSAASTSPAEIGVLSCSDAGRDTPFQPDGRRQHVGASESFRASDRSPLAGRNTTRGELLLG